jgi:tetratricopeptide (TPR) repeat protein
MAGQRAVLVLDNAAGSDQVTPLLPGDGGCLVLVTSRRYLGDLPGTAVPLLLQVLAPQQAQEMFARLVPRAAGLDAAVAELVRLAGFLPLAISLLARVYARHPSWTLADLAAETRASMLTLAAEKDSVATAFEVSYRYLDPGQREFFRRLGLHPGTTIDSYAAASLAGTRLREAARYLDALHGQGLLTEAGYRRYGMHDLIRRYARDHAAADPAPEREQALDRLLNFYQHTAALAEARLGRRARTSPAPDTPAPTAAPALAGADQALAWARAERPNLLACLDHAAGTGQHALVVALTADLATLLRQDGPWADALTRHATGVQTARRLGDRLGQANALLDLGTVQWLTGDYPGATGTLAEALGISRDLGDRLGQANALTDLGVVRWLTADYADAAGALAEALSIFRDLGDRLGQGNALTDLGVVLWLTGDYPGAAEAQQQALGIFRDLGDQRGEADALNRLGGVRRMTGDYPGAAAVQEEALGIYRNIGDRDGEVETLNELGTVSRIRGDLDRASACHRQALDLAREIATPWDEAQALAGLGRCALAAGRTADAIAGLRQAQEIFDRIGAAEAATIAAELDGLAGTGPTAHKS